MEQDIKELQIQIIGASVYLLYQMYLIKKSEIYLDLSIGRVQVSQTNQDSGFFNKKIFASNSPISYKYYLSKAESDILSNCGFKSIKLDLKSNIEEQILDLGIMCNNDDSKLYSRSDLFELAKSMNSDSSDIDHIVENFIKRKND